MARTFIGIKIDPGLLQKIGDRIGQLESSLHNVRWVSQQNIHITLKFLGNIDDKQIPPIGLALEQAIHPFPRFTINAKGLGVFPDLKRPRILWIGLTGSGLSLLASAVEKALQPLGFTPEAHGFLPHLTIGRWREFKRSTISLGKELEGWKNHEFGRSPVNEVIFFQSVLNREGAVYQILKAVELAEGF